MCVPAVPTGWTGPLEISEATGAKCGGVWTQSFAVSADPELAPATCSCSCGSPTNACAPPVVTFFKDGMCSQACGVASQAIGPACTTLNAGEDCKGGGTHFTVQSGAATAVGQCAPVATKTIPPVAWANHAVLCEEAAQPVMGTCVAGDVCSAATDPDFDPGPRCVMHDGALACPTGYPNLRTYYRADTDTRDCSACTCGAPAGVTCGNATVSLYTHPGCTGGESPMAMLAGCPALQGTVSALAGSEAPSGGACAPAGGQPVGTVTPTMPITICCTH